jgi:hypothetical protein
VPIALVFEEWTTLAGVGLAAIAAFASWASVAFGERARRAGLMPELVAQPIQPAGRERLDFLIYNGGGGLARGCSFVFVAGDHYALGRVSGGFLRLVSGLCRDDDPSARESGRGGRLS